MCGFAGFIDRKHLLRDPESALRLMSAAMRQHGSDAGVRWLDAACGVGIAGQRTTARNPTPDAHQPMHSRSGRYHAVIDGAISNLRNLQTQLSALGHAFRGDSDTEVLLAAFEQWGVPGAVERAGGAFAFAAWDSLDRKLHLVRDRLGAKPLYWGHAGPHGSVLVFGSELKSVRALPFGCPPIDADAVELFMRFGHVPSPYSIFKGLHKLLPAHRIEIDATTGSHLVHCQWSARDAAERGASSQIENYAEALAEVERCIEEAIDLELSSDAPIGSLLSGSIGSTLVTAFAARRAAGTLQTYFIGFGDSDSAALLRARHIAQHLGARHHELIFPATDAAALIPTIVDIHDEPFGDASAIPSYLLCRLARRDSAIALCGDGCEELFGTHDRYHDAVRGEALIRRWPPSLRSLFAFGAHAATVLPAPLGRRLSRSISSTGGHGTRDEFIRLSRLLRLRDARDVYPLLASEVDDVARALAHVQTPRCPLDDHAWCPDIACAVARGSARDMLSLVPDGLLTSIGRAGVAVGLETRAPLCDPRLVELALRIPARFKRGDSRDMRLLADLLDRRVPRQLIADPQPASAAPIGDWLRGNLREWGEDLLDPKQIEEQGLLDAHAVRDLWRRHQLGKSQRPHELWNCLMLQSWMRRLRSESTAINAMAAEANAVASIGVAEIEEAADRPEAPPQEPQHTPDEAETRRRFAGGTYWGLIQVIIQKGSAFLTYLVAAWTLQPSDVGSVATAVSFATLLSFIFPGAAGDILTHRQARANLWQTACLWLAGLGSVILIATCIAASPLIGWKYADSPIALFTILAAVRIAFDSGSMVGIAKLRLMGRFRKLAALDVGLAVITLAASAGLGLLGFGAWAIMAPMIVAAILRFTVIVTSASIPLYRPGSIARARGLWRDFCSGGLQHYLNGATQTVDYLALSLFSTESVLGHYTLAYQLTFTIHVALAYTVANIAQPLFGRTSAQVERLRDTFIATQRLTMTVAAPIFISLAIASPVIVRMLLPERWELAWVSISILSIAFLLMNPIQISSALLRARGRFPQLLRFQVLQTTILTVAVFAATNFGAADGVAFAVGLVGLVFGPLSIHAALNGMGGTGRAIREVYIAPLVAASLCLAPQFLLLRTLGDDTWASLGAQFGSGLVGLALYVGTLRFLSPSHHGQVRGLLAEIRSRASNPLGA